MGDSLLSGDEISRPSSPDALDRTVSGAPRDDITGEKLLPNEQVADANANLRRGLRWALLGSIAAMEIGALTLAYDLVTVKDAADAAKSSAEKADAEAQQSKLNDQETMMGHEKAKTLIIVGLIIFVLTLVTAAVRGELQRYFRRACGAERKLSRSLGHMMVLVYITVSVRQKHHPHHNLITCTADISDRLLVCSGLRPVHGLPAVLPAEQAAP